MSLSRFVPAVLLLSVALALASSTSAQTYSVLYSFTGGADGADPFGGLVRDSAGNLYGTTTAGSVFELSPEGKLVVLHELSGADGRWPMAGLVRDSAGDLYGTTTELGAYCCGTVFKIEKSGAFSVLHSFGAAGDGRGPNGVLTLDAAGNLYGTTPFGGNPGCKMNGSCGVVFKLDPSGNETILHSFKHSDGGCNPNGGLIRDAAGNLYGTTQECGNSAGGYGTIFELDHAGNETVLYTFHGKADGEYPRQGLLRDAAGNFYGTANGGILADGKKGAGVIFKLDTAGNYTVLFTFPGKSPEYYPDGACCDGALIMDAAGNLYDTAWKTVFKLNPSGNLTVLCTFTYGAGGQVPEAGLIMDQAGNLYGTTSDGGDPDSCGNVGCGVVFKVTP